VVSAIAVGLLGVVLAAPRAVAGPGEQQTRTTRATVVVTGIDRTHRTVTLQGEDGDVQTIDVPQEVKSYDTLKVGDKIDIDYQESIALSLLPTGTKPTASESSSMNRIAKGVGATSRQMTVSATVISVDPKRNKVTFKGPRGNVRTVVVDDPDVQQRLPALKVGQVVQITYTEAMVLSIRPSSGSSQWKP
jgi:Cu/Ag efflux protein CusF